MFGFTEETPVSGAKNWGEIAIQPPTSDTFITSHVCLIQTQMEVRPIQMLKGTFCIWMKHGGMWQNIRIWHPGNETNWFSHTAYVKKYQVLFWLHRKLCASKYGTWVISSWGWKYLIIPPPHTCDNTNLSLTTNVDGNQQLWMFIFQEMCTKIVLKMF